MALAKVNTNLRSSAPAPNPQDLSAIAMVIGPAAAGVTTPKQVISLADLAEFGVGSGPEMAAEILTAAGGPVYFTRSETTTAPTTGAVSKTPGNATGVAYPLYGGLVLTGADLNGNVYFRAVDPDATLTVVNGGSNGYAVANGTKDVTLTVTNSATGTDIAALALGAAAGILATPVALGTGASVVGQSLAKTALSKGGLNLTPKDQGVRFKTAVAGSNDAALSVAVANGTKDITITLGTTAGGQVSPVKNTGTLVKAALDGAPAVAALLTTGLQGDGTGMVGQAGGFVALQFGSTAALSLAGDATDDLNLKIEIVRGGALNASPAPTLRWSVDTLAGTSLTPNWSSETLIPSNGIVALKNGQIDTGLTATITGVLDKGDTWTAATTGPQSSTTAVLAAADMAIAEARFSWGFVTSPVAFNKSAAALMHAKCEAARTAGTRYVQALLNVRDIDLANSETAGAWRNAVEADYQGFVSARGIVTVCGGAILHASPLTGRQYRRPAVFAAAARKASVPIHENLGRVGRGPLARVLYLFHDESLNPQLHAARIVCPRTYPARPGFFYLCKAQTMADPTAPDDRGYGLYERVSIALSIARIGAGVALDYLLDSLAGEVQANPQQGAVAGALTLSDATAIESKINTAVETFVFGSKTDGKASASPLPVGQKMVKVRRDNNFVNDGVINLDCAYIPLGLAETVNLTVTVTIPQ